MFYGVCRIGSLKKNEMFKSLIIGIVFIIAMGVFWLLVQVLWKHVFRDEYKEDDVLAGRRNCSNCGCTSVCERKEEGLKNLEQNK